MEFDTSVLPRISHEVTLHDLLASPTKNPIVHMKAAALGTPVTWLHRSTQIHAPAVERGLEPVHGSGEVLVDDMEILRPVIEMMQLPRTV